MRTLCLNMIVKNEGKIITRLLESVYTILDTFCICDTGSTDDTIDLISKFFKEKKIEGKIISEPFINFEHNRNFALESCRGMSDYVLVLDADMVLEINTNFKLDLQAAAYYLHQGNENMMGKNVRFIKNDGSFKYYGVTHEALMTTTQHTSETLPKNNMFIRDIGDGGSKQDKFIRDKRLLLEAIKKDPDNSRYHLYLGNTFKALNDMTNAVKYYKRRIELENIRVHKYTEEVYFCYLKIGACLNNEESIHYWLMAHKCNPKRVEHLYELIRFYRLNKEYYLCNLFYEMAKSNLAPPFKIEDAHNFIFSSIIHYRFLIDYEYLLFACYLNIKTANSNIIKFFNECDEDAAYNNTLINIKHYKNILQPIAKLDLSERIQVNNSISMTSSSASLIPHLDGYLMNIRFVNYHITASGSYVKCDDKCDDKCECILTVNKCAIFDGNFKLRSSKVFSTVFDNNYIVGVEDVKIHRMPGGNIVFLASAQLNNTIQMKYGNYDITKQVLDSEFIKCSFENSQKEKNWVFIPNDKNEIIYKWFPLTICSNNNNSLVISQTMPMPKIFKNVRGSTSGYLYKNEIWFITHFVSDEQVRYYYNIFVIFDKEMNLQRYSPPFNFSTHNIEFCLSIIVEDSRVIIPHSVNDEKTYIGIYEKKMIDSFITDIK